MPADTGAPNRLKLHMASNMVPRALTTLSRALKTLRYTLIYIAMATVWLVLGMVYTERFPPVLDRLEPVLMPWNRLYSLSAVAVHDRMLLMQDILEASDTVANVSLITVTVSFSLLGVYLTLLYQQKKRRSRENELLKMKNQEIARRTEFIRYISATIGHEFKNNLGRIKRRVDLMPGLTHEVKERLEGNFVKLFADIDIFKKIADEREASLIEFQTVDLAEAAASIAAQNADLAEMTITDESPSPVIFASHTLLQTVFENIIDNAVKNKKASQEKANISLSLTMDDDGARRYLVLSFRDQGVGMTEEEAEQCFYKGTGSETGWGRGLYFAKYVVGLHAGKIRVGKDYTSPGRGTEIIIHLPYVEEELDV